jgi:hypothetical protein
MKKLRELSDNSDFTRLINEKANNDEVQREFTHLDEKAK